MVPLADEMTADLLGKGGMDTRIIPADSGGGPVTLPMQGYTPAIAGIARTDKDNGGYLYVDNQDRSYVGQPWPIDYPGETDANQGIAVDPQDSVDVGIYNDYEGPVALYQNGGATQRQVSTMQAHVVGGAGNKVDEIYMPWTGTGMAPYQVDTNILGPVSGRSEGMNGTTSQPDYDPKGQYGAATGGGTSTHETVTAYYMSQVDQVQRDYSASALFASI